MGRSHRERQAPGGGGGARDRPGSLPESRNSVLRRSDGPGLWFGAPGSPWRGRVTWQRRGRPRAGASQGAVLPHAHRATAIWLCLCGGGWAGGPGQRRLWALQGSGLGGADAPCRAGPGRGPRTSLRVCRTVTATALVSFWELRATRWGESGNIEIFKSMWRRPQVWVRPSVPWRPPSPRTSWLSRQCL